MKRLYSALGKKTTAEDAMLLSEPSLKKKKAENQIETFPVIKSENSTTAKVTKEIVAKWSTISDDVWLVVFNFVSMYDSSAKEDSKYWSSTSSNPSHHSQNQILQVHSIVNVLLSCKRFYQLITTHCDLYLLNRIVFYRSRTSIKESVLPPPDHNETNPFKIAARIKFSPSLPKIKYLLPRREFLESHVDKFVEDLQAKVLPFATQAISLYEQQVQSHSHFNIDYFLQCCDPHGHQFDTYDSDDSQIVSLLLQHFSWTVVSTLRSRIPIAKECASNVTAVTKIIRLPSNFNHTSYSELQKLLEKTAFPFAMDSNVLFYKLLCIHLIFSTKNKKITFVQGMQSFAQKCLLVYPFLYEYISKDLKQDKKFLLSLIKHNPAVMPFIQQFNSSIIDKNFCVEAIKKNFKALKYIPEEYKSDDDIVLLALPFEPYYIRHASSTLNNNKNMVLQIVHRYPSVFKFLSEAMQSDKDVLRAALHSGSPNILDSLSAKLKLDADVIYECILRQYCFNMNAFFENASKATIHQLLRRLQTSQISPNNEIFRSFCIAAVKLDFSCILLMDSILLSNREFMKILVVECPSALNHVHHSVLDLPFLVDVCQQNSEILENDLSFLQDSIRFDLLQHFSS